MFQLSCWYVKDLQKIYFQFNFNTGMNLYSAEALKLSNVTIALAVSTDSKQESFWTVDP